MQASLRAIAIASLLLCPFGLANAGGPVAVSGATTDRPELGVVKADSGDLLLKPVLPDTVASYKWVLAPGGSANAVLLIWIDGTKIETAEYSFSILDIKPKPKPEPKPPIPPTPIKDAVLNTIVFKVVDSETPEQAAVEKFAVDAMRSKDGSSRCRVYDVSVFDAAGTSSALKKYKSIIGEHRLPCVVVLSTPNDGTPSKLLEVVDEPASVDAWKALLAKHGEALK